MAPLIIRTLVVIFQVYHNPDQGAIREKELVHHCIGVLTCKVPDCQLQCMVFDDQGLKVLLDANGVLMLVSLDGCYILPLCDSLNQARLSRTTLS